MANLLVLLIMGYGKSILVLLIMGYGKSLLVLLIMGYGKSILVLLIMGYGKSILVLLIIGVSKKQEQMLQMLKVLLALCSKPLFRLIGCNFGALVLHDSCLY